MQTAQLGDHVRVHYTKRFQDGSVASSHKRAPIDVVVGIDHPRLPGLGQALVGLTPGTRATLTVDPEHAFGVPDPNRIRNLARTQFFGEGEFVVGKRMLLTDRRGQRRRVRIVNVREKSLTVDINHPRAGQTLHLEVELVTILPSE